MWIDGNESVSEVDNKLETYFVGLVDKELSESSPISDNAIMIRIQVAGYDQDDVKIRKTYFLRIGNSNEINHVHEIRYGATWRGDGRAISK